MENENLKVYALSDIINLRVHGRTTGCLSPLTLFWTGSAVEFNVKGSELWVEAESDYDTYEPWISILINSCQVNRQMLIRGRYWLCVFRGMNPNEVKNVRIIRELQAMSPDPGCSLKIHAVKTDGEFLPVEEKPYKIEFVGDSITSGEGAVGARKEEDWIPMWFSAVNNYCRMTAEVLNADYRIISQSGWGVLSSWDNNPHGNIPDYYEKVCGLLTGEKNKALGAFKENDFASWQPDIIVVNLGTNDVAAYDTPEYKDEATGRIYKQRRNEDGTFSEESVKAFEEAVIKFLYKLRKYNKNAYIVWAYGMIEMPMMPYIYRAVDTYSKAEKDKKVSVFQLPNTAQETLGARSHPGRAAHEKAARELAGYLKPILMRGN